MECDPNHEADVAVVTELEVDGSPLPTPVHSLDHLLSDRPCRGHIVGRRLGAANEEPFEPYNVA